MKFLPYTIALVIGSTICIASAQEPSKRPRKKARMGTKTARREQKHRRDAAADAKDGRTLIVGGTPAKVGAYPYFVDLDGCGGSLIAPGVVLSAAHCDPYGFSFVGESVIVGAYDRGQVTNGAVRATVTASLPHPAYDVPNSVAYDFLLLKLDSPVNASGSVDFSLNTARSIPTDAEMLTVFGVGTTAEGSFFQPDSLLEVDVPATSTDSCNGPYDGDVRDDVMFCAGGKDGKDSCQGDSGGPIVIKNGNTHTQVGVVSFGEGCARPGIPGIYARVSAAMNWIAHVTCTCWGVDHDDICRNLNPNDNFSCESVIGGGDGGGGGNSGCEIADLVSDWTGAIGGIVGGGVIGEAISSWTDVFNDGCAWYEQNDVVGCPLFGYIEDSLGVSAWDVCCHCEGGNPYAGSDQAGCEVIPGWTDVDGFRCGWYEVHDSPGCPLYGYIEDENAVSAFQACCHCEGGSLTNDYPDGCELIAGWYDGAGDSCGWYELYDSPGCPSYGGVVSFDGTTAWEACCHCQGGNNGNQIGDNGNQTGCELIAGWVDAAGDGCEWYESNEAPGCPSYGGFTSTDGTAAWDACCHCQGGGIQPGCEVVPGWADSLGYGCGWYEIFDTPGCPIHGFISSADGTTAWDACCHCEGGGIQPGCELVPGWVDSFGTGCGWYEINDSQGCPLTGFTTSSNGTTAWEACCHCEGGGTASACELVTGWVDTFGFGCAWFESVESPGCPNYGSSASENGTTAWEACCHCEGGGTGDGNSGTAAPSTTTALTPELTISPTTPPTPNTTNTTIPGEGNTSPKDSPTTPPTQKTTIPGEGNTSPGDSGMGRKRAVSTVTGLVSIVLALSFAA